MRRPAGTHSGTRAAVGSAAVLLIAGCGAAVDGRGSVAATGSRPSPTASLTPTPSPTTTQRDFRTVSFSIPAGFEPGVGYGAAVPLEAVSPVRNFFVPTGRQGGLDLVSVIVYTLPTPGAAATPAQQLARIQAYNVKLRATVTGGIRATTLAGIAGYTENVVQPAGTRVSRGYRYSTWFAFGRASFVQVSCQTDTATFAARIAAACTIVRSTLRTV